MTAGDGAPIGETVERLSRIVHRAALSSKFVSVPGPIPTARYDSARARLVPGDLVVMYTDGLVEREDPDQDPFGIERLRALLARCAGASANVAVDTVLAAVSESGGRAPVADDMTVVVVKRVCGASVGGTMRNRISSYTALACAVLVSALALAQEPAPIKLPAPQKDGGKPLMQALALRATSREFAPEPLPAQTVSNLLWAAWGINRPQEGKRTAPSARNWQEIDVVAVMPAGAYRYDAAGHLLNPIARGDLRALTGGQDFVREAPLTLVFVADTRRMKGAAADTHTAYAWADAAFISENVYLFCASEGLATGVRAMVDRPALGKALNLAEGQVVVFAQSVGFPTKK